MIICLAKNFIKKENLNKFFEYADELVKKTNEEEGCIEYQYYQSKEDETVFCFIEKWESKKYFDLHVKSPHFKDLVPKIQKLAYKYMTAELFKGA